MNTSRTLVSMIALGALALTLAAGMPAWADDGAAAPAEADIQALIRQLGDDSFETRTKATDALKALGAKAAPALRDAVKGADSEEVRWRAEQLLLQLEGAKSERLGNRDRAPKLRPPPRPSPFRFRRPNFRNGQSIEDIFKSLQEQLSRLDKDLGGFLPGLRDRKGLFGLTGGSRTFTKPGLNLSMEMGRASLRVEDESGAIATYRGRSLDDILTRHPSLRSHRSMQALQEAVREAQKDSPMSSFDSALRLFKQFQNGRHRIGLQFDADGKMVTRHVQIETTDAGTKVRIVETDQDGNETVKELEGESLDAIKRAHPDLDLGGVQIHLSLPQIFLGQGRGRALEPDEEPQSQPVPTPPARRPFGIHVDEVSEALALQLGLGDQRGVMVKNVMPGTAAQAIGLKPYDILLAVDGTPVTRENVRGLLAEKVEPDSAVTLTVMRRAQRITLRK